jgi:Cdc6-like AAA superfamily ATPase
VYTRSKEVANIALEIFQQRVISRTYGQDKKIKIIPIIINPLIIKDEDKMFAQIQEELKDVWCISERTRENGIVTLRETLRAVSDIGVLIILEELEANVIGKKQGLLYGLFDLQHYDSIKLFSVLVAQNIGIVDHFEKRVKSRYSHRFFFLLSDRHVFLYKIDFSFFTKAFDYILNIESDTKLHNILVLYAY